MKEKVMIKLLEFMMIDPVHCIGSILLIIFFTFIIEDIIRTIGKVIMTIKYLEANGTTNIKKDETE